MFTFESCGVPSCFRKKIQQKSASPQKLKLPWQKGSSIPLDYIQENSIKSVAKYSEETGKL